MINGSKQCSQHREKNTRCHQIHGLLEIHEGNVDVIASYKSPFSSGISQPVRRVTSFDPSCLFIMFPNRVCFKLGKKQAQNPEIPWFQE